MKLPFSYKQSFFKSILVGSALAHVVFFVQPGFFSQPPQYGVEAAPSSMEIIFVKQPEARPEIKTDNAVMTARQDVQEAPPVAQKKTVEQKTPEKSVYIPPVRGALTEAKPSYLKNPAPIYPLIARENGWEGVVMLKVRVSPQGRTESVEVSQSSGYRVLDESALKTVKTWMFEPAHVGALKLQSEVIIPIRFLLEK